MLGAWSEDDLGSLGDASSRSTHDFEAYVIGWMKETSILAISRPLGMGWKGIAGIQRRAGEGSKKRVGGCEYLCG